MIERYEIKKDNRTFCFCEICYYNESGEEAANRFAEDLISGVRCGIDGYINEFVPADEEGELIERWSIVPYRFRFSIVCRELGEGLFFIDARSAFDARFPRGRHIQRSMGFIFDARLGLCLNPSFVFFPGLSSRAKREKGTPLCFACEKNQIQLVCADGKCAVDIEFFCKNYKRISDLALNFDKKTIDKRGNI